MSNEAQADADPIGVVLVHVGTPDAPTPTAVRRYLVEFLSDPRIVDLPAVVWRPLLRFVIAPIRARRVADLYREIWDTDHDESPLRRIARRQACELEARFDTLFGHGRVVVRHAMRYGRPGLATVLDELMAAGARRLLVAPLYPQYSTATTASVLDELARWKRGRTLLPALRTLPPWYDDPAYIEVLAASVRKELSALEAPPPHLVVSFHGLPLARVAAGDPYEDHCRASAEALRRALDWPQARFHLAFQSRFGPARWLGPSTEETVRELAAGGVRSLALVAPGFTADCLETLEELDRQVAKVFHEAGGRQFVRVPCLNDSPGHLDLLAHLVLRELGGWL